MHVPKSYWSDAVLTACHLINRMPSTVLGGQIPYTVLSPGTPLFHLPPKIFGCVCYVHILGPGSDKLDPRYIKCVFLGYSRTQKGYQCYSPTLRCRFISADVTFDDDLSPISLLRLLVTVLLLVFLSYHLCRHGISSETTLGILSSAKTSNRDFYPA